MNLPAIFGHVIALPAWVPAWAIPAAMIHIALFLTLIVPAWVGLARARAGGPLSLLLIFPILGLLMLCPIYMNRVLPYAHWGRFWGILVLIPGLNIFFLWIFSFAPWKRRYIPLAEDEESEKLSARTGLSAPRFEGRGGEPRSQAAEAPGFSREPAMSPRTGEPGSKTMMAGRPQAIPPAPESAPPIMLPGGRQKLDEPVVPNPPIPARSLHPQPPPQPPAAPPKPPTEPAAEPPRPRVATRTQDLSIGTPPPQKESATVRVSPPARAGGRAWRLIGANDVAAAIEFNVPEQALLEAEGGLLVGRSARAHFVIEHDSISRNHARFILERGVLSVEDLDSMNGTWVDGQKLEPQVPVALQPNSIVEIGKIKLRVTAG